MTTSRRWWVFALVSLALFMSSLDNLVVTTALPAIQHALHATLPDLEWTVNAYTLVFTVMMIPMAALGDRFGHKRVLLIGVALFTFGSALAALSAGATMLALARAVQGLGGACIAPLTLTILTRAFPAKQRALVIGLWSGVSGLGLTIGPLVGGAIVNGWNWNGIFWINVPLGIILLLLGLIRLPESYGEQKPLDLLGSLLIGTSLLFIVIGLSSGNITGWFSLQVVGTLFAGVVLLGAFVVRERITTAPMIDLSLFTLRSFTVANIVGFLMSFGMFGSIFFITQFIQNILHVSPLLAGLETIPWTATIMLVSPFSGVFTQRLGIRPVLLFGMLAQALALIGISILATKGMSYLILLPLFVLAGIGMGLSFGPVSTAVMSAVSTTRQGQASSISNTTRELGGVFGIAIMGAVFGYVAPLPNLFFNGFRATLFVGAGLLLIGGLLTVFITPPTPSAVEEQENLQEIEPVPVSVL